MYTPTESEDGAWTEDRLSCMLVERVVLRRCRWRNEQPMKGRFFPGPAARKAGAHSIVAPIANKTPAPPSELRVARVERFDRALVPARHVPPIARVPTLRRRCRLLEPVFVTSNKACLAEIHHFSMVNSNLSSRTQRLRAASPLIQNSSF